MAEGNREGVLLEAIQQDVQTVLEGHSTINQKIDRVGHELGGEIRQLDGKVDLHTRTLIQRIDEGFGTFDQQLNGVEGRLSQRVNTLDRKFDALDQKVDGVEGRLNRRIDAGFTEMKSEFTELKGLFQEHLHDHTTGS